MNVNVHISWYFMVNRTNKRNSSDADVQQLEVEVRRFVQVCLIVCSRHHSQCIVLTKMFPSYQRDVVLALPRSLRLLNRSKHLNLQQMPNALQSLSDVQRLFTLEREL